MASTTVTNAYIQQAMNAQDLQSVDLGISYFKISEGGWEDVGGGVKAARTPDPTLTDVDAIINPGRYPADSRFVFQKSIPATAINVISSTEIEIQCFVGSAEANDDGNGNSPEFWELGIFAADGTMIVHHTFDQQTKDDRRALRHIITITRSLV